MQDKKSHGGFKRWGGCTIFPEPRKPWFIKQRVRSVSAGGGKGWRQRRLWEISLPQIFTTGSLIASESASVKVRLDADLNSTLVFFPQC